MILDPWFFALAVPAMLIVGISKGGFGGGLGTIGVPMMSIVVPPTLAASVMLPTLIAMDVVALWSFRGTASRRHLAVMLPGAGLGILLAWATVDQVPAAGLTLIIGIEALVFGALPFLRRGPPAPTPAPLRPTAGVLAGLASGYASFVAHAGGPPINLWLLPQRLAPLAYGGTTVIYFAAVNAAKAPVYVQLGQFTPETLWTSLALAPFAPVGVLIGRWALTRMDPQRFYTLIHVLLIVTGLHLTIEATIALWG